MRGGQALEDTEVGAEEPALVRLSAWNAQAEPRGARSEGSMSKLDSAQLGEAVRHIVYINTRDIRQHRSVAR